MFSRRRIATIFSWRPRAGFVLTGGRSSRMGRDKALLPIEGSPLVERTAERVRAAAGSVTADRRSRTLCASGASRGCAIWLKTVGLSGGLLHCLEDRPRGLESAGRLRHARPHRRVPARACSTPPGNCGSACLVPQTDSGLHPLCAVYHRRAEGAVESAIDHKRFKMHDLLKVLGAVSLPGCRRFAA